MRNICMISQSPYPYDPRVRRQAEKLAKAGFYVDILCIPQGKDLPVEQFGDNITAYRVIKKNKGQESIRKYLLLSFKFFISAYMKLRKLNRAKKYSLIQIHNMPEAHVFIAWMQKIKGTPVLLDIHDLTPELLTSKWNNKASQIFKPVVIFLEKISCRFASHIITVTEGCKEILVSRSAPVEKISLVLNTANTGIFPFYSERSFRKIEQGVKLLYHGTAAERFGLHILIAAMPRILKHIPGSILRVHGKYDADYKIYLQEQIKKLKLGDNVILGGALFHEDIYEIMKQSDIEVVPYLSNEYMNLSLSTKTFECAAAGLPIVATELRTLKMTFDDNAIKYVKDQDPGDIADKIIFLCKNPSERENMTRSAYTAISAISGDIMEERYLEIIEKISGIKRIDPVGESPELLQKNAVI